MWCLVSSNGQVSYNVTPGKIHIVSRKVGDIILANDQSVSRKHAYLEVKYPITDGIQVWDDSSKYGSFINEGIQSNARLDKEKKYTLKEGGTVRFGLQDNIWTLKREVPLVLGYMLKPAELKKIVSAISKSGGKCVGTWTKDITHVCTNTVRLSFEVMCALASAKPIVTPLFWEHYSLMLAGKGALADPAKFIPAVHDSQMSGRENLWLPNVARKTLFKDKLFIIPDCKNFEELKTVVELAGGKVTKLSDCKLTPEEYCKPNVLVLKCSKTSQETKLYKEILNKYALNKWQPILEEDIGLALWKVSTEKHCNPAFSSSNILVKLRDTSSPPDTGATLVMNTEDLHGASTGQTHTNQTDLVIPPSCSENMNGSDDKTQSFNPRTLTEKYETMQQTPSTSRKRGRESEEISAIHHNKSPNISNIKSEPGEDDLFADDLPERNTKNTIQKNKTPVKKLDDDDFFLPSPPKRKKSKKSVLEDDMFDLPEPPPSTQASKTINNDDDFSLPSPPKRNLLNSSKLNKLANNSVLNESNDLFESLESTSTQRAGKRKGRNDSESDDPPPKRPINACVDVTNVHEQAVPPQTKALNFISKPDIKPIKKEHKGGDLNDEDDISFRLQTKVVLAPLLIKKKDQQNLDNSKTSNPSVKNFKKFRKNWGGSTSKSEVRNINTTTRVLITTAAGRSRSSISTNANSEEDEDDPFSPVRNGHNRRNITGRNTTSRNNVNQSDDDDEFALPSFSQV